MEIYEINLEDFTLHQKNSITCNIQTINVQCIDDLILVGDYMMSLTLYSYNPADGSISEIAQDGNESWVSCMQMLNKNVNYLCFYFIH